MSQKSNNKLYSISLLLLFTVSILPPLISQNQQGDIYFQDFNNLTDLEDNLENSDNYNNDLKLSYIPIDSYSGFGDNVTIEDNLGVYQQINTKLDLDNDYNDSYEMTIPAGYIVDSLRYNLTLESALEKTEYQASGNKIVDELSSTLYRYAFKFDVSTNYANFTGAQLWLENYGGGYGGDELELFLVEEDGSGLPNMSAIISTDLGNPYSSLNHFPVSSTGNVAYFDFVNCTLSMGSYFVVANLSSYDGDDDTGILWRSQQTEQSRSYYYEAGSWSALTGRTLVFISHLIETDEFGNKATYSDPTSVNLQDNEVVVTSLDQLITTVGVHYLASDIPVSLYSNNSYHFSRTYSATSTYDASNSTYHQSSNTWKISWSIANLDLNGFTNPTRIQRFSLPNDWNKTSYSFLHDAITPILGEWISDTYEYNLSSILILNEYSGGNFEFETTSPNYIISTTLIGGVPTLGYWTNNETHAFGHEGSTIYSIADIENLLTSGGSFNFSLFDNSGNIIAQKISIPTNLIYIDNTSYTKEAYIQGSLYRANITFDPSVYGTDVEGPWTAFFLWTNGTEVGFFSQTIEVVKPTLAKFFVEDEVGGDFIELSSTEITRINGEEINIRINYYNISDPFISGLGVYIPSGDVYYTTSWADSNNLIYDTGNYSYGLSPNITEGSYLIDLYAEGPFLQSHSAQFSLVLLHQFNISVQQSQEPVFYTDDSEVVFALKDITNGSILISPDTLSASINGDILAQTLEYNYTFIDEQIVITVFNEVLDLLPANYELEVTVTKTNFVENIGVEQTSTTSNYDILAVADTSVGQITTVTETNTSSQVVLTFEWIDETHSEQIKGATVAVTLDIPEPDVELIENSEDDGIYTIIVRIHEPTIKTLNVRVTVSKDGYETVLSFILASISITTPSLPTTPPPPTPTNGELPIGLIIGLSLVAVAGLGVGAFFVTRTQLSKRKEEYEEHKSKARAIFQSAFMIKRILVVHHETSSPIYEYSLDERAELDPSIISGVLQAISSIGAEMSGARTGIKKIEYYNFVVTSASSGVYTAYIFSDTELEVEFEKGLDNLVNWFDIIFGYQGAQWDGSMDAFNEYKETINEKVVEELFLWFMFPLQVSPQILEDLDKLKIIDQEIISFINSKGKATSALIMDQLDEYTKEEILERIMAMVKEEKLKTNNNDAPV